MAAERLEQLRQIARRRYMDIPGAATENHGMKYKVALHVSDEGYSVSVPGLPGCWSQGATEEEALANIQEAIREYLDVASELANEQEMREVEVKG